MFILDFLINDVAIMLYKRTVIFKKYLSHEFDLDFNLSANNAEVTIVRTLLY